MKAIVVYESHWGNTAAIARFIVQGKYGPLRAGELERAKAWGAALARELQ